MKKATTPLSIENDSDIPEVQALYKGIKKGVEYICKQFDMLDDAEANVDPNDVVKWIEKSYTMAQNIIAFYHLVSNVKPDDNIRGGARVNKFELPESGIR